MKFRPCIDLHAGKVKQIVGETLNSKQQVQENFVSPNSPAWFAQLYQKHQLSDGHVIMLGQNNENKNAAKEALQAYPQGLQIGGGMHIENAQDWLDYGASAIIFSSYLITKNQIDFNKLQQLKNKIGQNKIVIDLSCIKSAGKYFFAFNQWNQLSDFELNQVNLMRLGEYCKELLIHAVDVEGKKAGIDQELIKLLAKQKEIKIVYAGGIHHLDDIEYIAEVGENQIDFTVGSSLDIFGGHLQLNDLIQYQ